jgi:metallo-beta-lactamase family protein
MQMFLRSYGAVKEVTGSMHLLTSNSDNILLDCGMFQGKRRESDEKNRNFPIDPQIISNIILSHAHIDHSGRLPILAAHNFTGRIISTRATRDACQFLLMDSAHIHESDAAYVNYRTVKYFLREIIAGNSTVESITNKEMRLLQKELKSSPYRINQKLVNQILEKYNLNKVLPLYTSVDAETILKQFESYPLEEPVIIGHNATCTFYNAGHILGSAVSIIKIKEKNKTYRVMYSGDLGRFDKPIIKNPNTKFLAADRNIDLLILESTYGDRDHEPVTDLSVKMKEIIQRAYNNRGAVIIPSFAFGRTQELIYIIHNLYKNKEVPKLPVYIDSPLAANMTQVYGEHPELFDRQTHLDFLQDGDNPFWFKQLTFTESVEDSMALMKDTKSRIVISASGMCESGRILHHLRYGMHNPANIILFVGFMAKHTLGRRLLDSGLDFMKKGRQGEPPQQKIFNKSYPLRAEVEKIDGFSAHGDRNEMLRFLKESKLKIKKIALVHGEESQIDSFKNFLTKAGYNVVIPKYGELITI